MLAGAATFIASGTAQRQWESFKNPKVTVDRTTRGATASRFAATSGNGRYQYWASGLDAFRTDPLKGIGAGSFESWWARHATLPGFIRNAHSLYIETLAEVGAIGLILLGGMLVTIGLRAVTAIRRGATDQAVVASSAAAIAAFATSASVDWVWQVAVLPVIVMLLAGAIVTAGEAPEDASRRGRTSWRLGCIVFAAAAVLLLAIPLIGTVFVRKSQSAAQQGNLRLALRNADQAADLQPFAATSQLQRALVYESAGEYRAASRAAREAARLEPTNWRPAFVLSRIEAQRGRAQAAVTAYRRARQLNPRSEIFR
jgi:O-antigen ligase